MNAPHEPATRRAAAGGPVRRMAAVPLVSGLVFLVLWLVVFSAVTSALVAGGLGVVVMSAGAASDPVGTVLDAIAAFVSGVLTAIAAFFAAIFSIFGL